MGEERPRRDIGIGCGWLRAAGPGGDEVPRPQLGDDVAATSPTSISPARSSPEAYVRADLSSFLEEFQRGTSMRSSLGAATSSLAAKRSQDVRENFALERMEILSLQVHFRDQPKPCVERANLASALA